MEKNRHLKLWKDDQGQALVEASIGVALMALTWTMLVVLSIMSTNASRTAMAARHGAWIKGNAPDRDEALTRQLLVNEFFYHDGALVQVEFADGEGSKVKKNQYEGDVDPASAESVEETLDSGNGPYAVTVTFGARNDALKAQMPWALLDLRLPFMPAMDDAEGLFVVDTGCQWEEVSETWTDAGEAILGIFSTLKSIITNALSLS